MSSQYTPPPAFTFAPWCGSTPTNPPRVLTPEEVAALFNGGQGISYPAGAWYEFFTGTDGNLHVLPPRE